jgi:siroheme decarboxylase
MKRLDDTDRQVLNLMQQEFPLVSHPFLQIGESLGLTEQEVLARVKRLKEAGLIRRIGPVLERRKLGYASCLCGVAVDEARIAEVAQEISKHAGITHSYERNGDLNLWFTITKKTAGEIDGFLKEIEKRFGLIIYRFPARRVFKIKTFFPL